MAKREIAERIDGQQPVEASTPGYQLADARGECDAAGKRRAAAIAGAVDQQPSPDADAAATTSACRCPLADERRRLERDLHDGVQNELVAPIIKLALAQQNAETPPALGETLAGLEARAPVALDLVRNIARGVHAPQLAQRLPVGSVPFIRTGSLNVRGSG